LPWAAYERRTPTDPARLLSGLEEWYSLFTAGICFLLFLALLAAGSSNPIRVWQPAVLLAGGALLGVVTICYFPAVVHWRGGVWYPHAGFILTLISACSVMLLGAVQFRCWVQRSKRPVSPTTAESDPPQARALETK
jgi:hypothetical protein